MRWLRKLWVEVVTMLFMMVGITPPKSARSETAEQSKEQDKLDH